MKKWIIVIVSLAVILLSTLYFIIPADVTIVNTANMKANASAVIRTLWRQPAWNSIAGGRIAITKPLANGAEITIAHKGALMPGQLIVLPIREDSCTIRWDVPFSLNKGPGARISNYFGAVNLKKEMEGIVHRLKTYCQQDSNTYGFKINNESTTDTSLLATRFASASYPDMEKVYAQIARLKKWASSHGLEQVSYPMLNVTMNADSSYKCMVAIPIDRKIDLEGEIFFTRMEPGRFITAEVNGGIASVQHAHDMVRSYIYDYKKLLMAMPFEHLITDRHAEKDTAKWVTRLYYPVP